MVEHPAVNRRVVGSSPTRGALTSCCAPGPTVGRPACGVRPIVQRPLGALVIAFGTLLVGFSPNRWDVVFLELPRGHGVHVHELVGVIAIAIGIATLWVAPPRET